MASPSFWIILFLFLVNTHETVQNCILEDQIPLYNNGIRHVQCSGLHNLSDIYVQYRSNWQYNVTVVNSTISVLPQSSPFSEGRRIWSLDMDNSGIRDIHSGALDPLTDIREIVMSRNNLTVVGDGVFGNLTTLERLDLSRNSIETVGEHALLSTIRLTELRLQENALPELPPTVLRALHSLSHLNLSHNRLVVLDDKHFVTNVKLLQLDLSFNGLSNVTAAVFKPLVSLRLLDISYNPVHHVDAGLTPHAVNLTVFRAAGLAAVREGLVLPSRTNAALREIDLAHNAISQVRDQMFGHLSDLRTLDLSYNAIATLDNFSFFGLYQLEALRLDHNRLRVLPDMVFVSQKNLRSLDLSRNPLQTVLIPLVDRMTGLRALRLDGLGLDGRRADVLRRVSHDLAELHLAANGFAELTADTLGNFSALLVLDAGHNAVRRLEPGVFSQMTRLRRLCLRANRLQAVLATTFIGLSALRHLDLSDNRLVHLPAGTFDDLRALASLNLSANHLRILEPLQLHALVGLRDLRLDDNDLVDVEGLYLLTGLRTVSLQNNAWDCETLYSVQTELGTRGVQVAVEPAKGAGPRLDGVTCGNRKAPLTRIADADADADEQIADPDIQKLRRFMDDAFLDINDNFAVLANHLREGGGVGDVTGEPGAAQAPPRPPPQLRDPTALLYVLVVLVALMLCAACLGLYLRLGGRRPTWGGARGGANLDLELEDTTLCAT